MNPVEKVEWDPKYSVDIEEIDTHQKKMFELFNQLIDLKEAKKESKECINMISEINEYSKFYFSTEERHLRRKGYPDFAIHAKAHRQFTKRSISLRREIAEDIENLSYEVINELRNWLIDHIVTYDAMYIPYLRINRFVEEAKQKN